MKRISPSIVCLALFAVLTAGVARAQEQASGKLTDVSIGKVTLGEGKDVARVFSLAFRTTQFEPTDWRPTKGDEVKLTYTTKEGRRGTVLAVDKLTLVKAGPDTVVSLASPAQGEVTEKGRSAFQAKLAGGQFVKFSFSKKTEHIPKDWVPAVGDKVKVAFRTEPALIGFSLVYLADKVEKVP